MEIKKDHINFSVGPVQISPEIACLGADPVPYFRTPDFSKLMLENERLLKKMMGAPEDARAVFLTGSGTASMDAAVNGLFTKKDKLLIVCGGSFGHRFCEISEAYGIPYEAIELENGQPLTAQHLEAHEGCGFTGFLVNMHETSTGVLYDMNLIGTFCRRNHLILVVDAISAFLADPLNMTEIGADIVLTGSQKALAVPPGVSMMVLSSRAVERVYANQPACYYLSLKAALKNGERGQTPFTPAVGILIQINARLKQIDAVGMEAERERIQSIASDFRTRIRNYPLRMFSQSPSDAVTSLTPVSSEVSAFHIFEVLKEEYNIIICPNGGDLAEKVFRVGHLGNLTIADNDALFAALDDLVRRGILHD